MLGSGLGNYAGQMKVMATIPYGEIDGFPVSTAPGHVGQFVFGYVEDTPVVAMQGRVHYYEGYEMTDVVLPIRLMKMMGTKVLFLTNAAGGIKRGFCAGDLMMITGQIATLCTITASWSKYHRTGKQISDMSHIYDEDLQQVIRRRHVN